MSELLYMPSKILFLFMELFVIFCITSIFFNIAQRLTRVHKLGIVGLSMKSLV